MQHSSLKNIADTPGKEQSEKAKKVYECTVYILLFQRPAFLIRAEFYINYL